MDTGTAALCHTHVLCVATNFFGVNSSFHIFHIQTIFSPPSLYQQVTEGLFQELNFDTSVRKKEDVSDTSNIVYDC
jgi:hypothetical protein